MNKTFTYNREALMSLHRKWNCSITTICWSVSTILFAFFILFLQPFNSALGQIHYRFQTKSPGELSQSLKPVSSNQSTTFSKCAIYGKSSVTIEHEVTTSCQVFEVNGDAEVFLINGGSLHLQNDFELYGQAHVLVDENTTLHIDGNLSISGNADLIVDGTIIVEGNIIVSGSGSVCGKGKARASGKITGTGWCYALNLTPHENLSLQAKLDSNQNVELSWVGATSFETDYFMVERSPNGMSFSVIAKIESKASQTGKDTIRFSDHPTIYGTYYYRISQYAQNDKARASELMSISIFDHRNSFCELEIIPNPCIPFCEARIIDCPDGNFKTQILDASGNIVTELLPKMQDGENITYHINTENFLLPGVYIINSVNDKARLTKKIIVK